MTRGQLRRAEWEAKYPVRFEGGAPKALRAYALKHRSQIREVCGKGIMNPDLYDVDLRPGWRKNDDLVHAVNGATVDEILGELRSVVPCDCDDCRKEAAK